MDIEKLINGFQDEEDKKIAVAIASTFYLMKMSMTSGDRPNVDEVVSQMVVGFYKSRSLDMKLPGMRSLVHLGFAARYGDIVLSKEEAERLAAEALEGIRRINGWEFARMAAIGVIMSAQTQSENPQ